MQILKHLENSFVNSSFKVKVELYLLVLIIFILLLYNADLFSRDTYKLSVNNNYKINEFNTSLLDINKTIEEYASLKKINITSMRNERKEMFISSSLSLSKVKTFISFLENINNYSNIKTLSLEKQKKSKKYNLEIKISFEEYFFKTLGSEKITKKSRFIRFKLKAIIDENVLINNKWLEVGDKINGYELTNISNDGVVLSLHEKTIKLKVFKNDKY